MKSSLKIGSVLGIPIKLHITFLLILPVFAYIFAINPYPYGFQEVEPASTKYMLSSLTAILLFASILLHELAHSYLAKQYGVNIESITLFLFGGVSSMEEIPRDPGQEAKMAFAGAAFTSYVFEAYHPDSAWKIPVTAASFSLATATAALRVASGNHFPSDVLAGAVLGTLVGVGIPFLHRSLASKQELSASVSPYGIAFRVALR